MEEQLCQYCELVEEYTEDVLHSETKEELVGILHELIHEVSDLAQLELIDNEIDLLRNIKMDIIDPID